MVLNQIQTNPNRRVLAGMESFRVPGETPDAMADLLRRMEMAEHSAAMAAGSRSSR